MAVKTYKGAKARADKLFSEVIRSVGYCEAEQWDEVRCSPQLQTMHIVSRKYSATRCDTRNAIAGCAAHHRYFTDHPRQFSRFITTSLVQPYYETVWRNSRDSSLGKKVDWNERVEWLTRIKQGELSLAEARELEN